MNLYSIHNKTDSFDSSQFEKIANQFIPYHQQELQWNKPVNINLVSDQENSKNPLGKTAYYDPDKVEIVLYIDNRHVKDILRSLSHELVHHLQNCKGTLTPMQGEDPQYAQNDENLRKCEEEAYLVGNMIFRDWEDQFKTKETLNETLSELNRKSRQFLVTWNYPGSDELTIVSYPDPRKMPNQNDFGTNASIYLRRYLSSFDSRGTLTFWKLHPKVNFDPDIYEPGEQVPAAAIDYGIAGDYKVVAQQDTIHQQDAYKLIKEAYMSFKDSIPNNVEEELVNSIPMEQNVKNQHWIGTAKYGKNNIEQSYYWIKIDKKYFVISDSSLYGKELLEIDFDTRKEARQFGLKQLEEIGYEVDLIDTKTYKDRENNYFNQRQRRNHYGSLQEREKEYKNKLIKNIYKKFNIYHKLVEEDNYVTSKDKTKKFED